MLLRRHTAAAMLAVAVVVGCGGGGGGRDDAPGSDDGGGAITTLSVSGIAATGAPIGNGVVHVRCATGTSTGTTQANGSYSVEVQGGQLPCVIRVTKNGVSLHSVVEVGATVPAAANVTPMTELLVAQIAGRPAASVFSPFTVDVQALLTAQAVTNASAQVIAALEPTVDFRGIDLLRGTLVPAFNGNTGNEFDQKLDALANVLSQTETRLTDLAAELVANPGQPPFAFNRSEICPALRSGPYWGLDADHSGLSGIPFTVDASALTLNYGGNVNRQLVPSASEACRFTLNDANNVDKDVIVSQSGVMVVQYLDGGERKSAIMLPKQNIALRDVAERWNYLGWSGTASEMTPVNGAFSIETNGNFAEVEDYIGMDRQDGLGDERVRLVKDDATGIFKQVVNNVETSAIFLAYRAPNDRIYLVGNPRNASPGLIFAAPRLIQTLPTINSQSKFWELQISQGAVHAIQDAEITITGIDGWTVMRYRPDIQRQDMLRYESPRLGMRTRLENDCRNNQGIGIACSAMVQLPLVGTGINVASGFNSNSFFTISVGRP